MGTELSELLSHPDQHYVDHVSGVVQLAQQFVNELHISLLSSQERRQLPVMMALCHDIGKATDFFQCYIDPDRHFAGPHYLKHHSLISAIITYFIVKDYIVTREKKDDFLPFLAYLGVRRHHSHLKDWLAETKLVDEWDVEILKRQIKAINYDKLNQVMCTICQDNLEKWEWPVLEADLLFQWVEAFPAELRRIRRQIRRDKQDHLEKYFLLQLLFSFLIDADKSQVGIDKYDQLRRYEISTEWIPNYKSAQKWTEHTINRLREAAYEDVINYPISLDQHLYALQLPTGLGKTLTALQFAFKLREKLKQQHNVTPRIIYTLPFLGVIDQTVNTLNDIFKSNGVSVDSLLLLAHHHLSPLDYTVKDDVDYQHLSYEASKLLIEGWHSELVVTTFVQLFETILSNRNKHLRRFHRLANSIVIVDEVQAVPHKYWLLIRRLFIQLAETLNIYFVFTTATVPAIFSSSELTTLVDSSRYYEKLNRVQLIPRIALHQSLQEFIDGIHLLDNKRYLFIMNTIQSAKRLYRLINKQYGRDREVAFLSTHLTPWDRNRVIKGIKNSRYDIVVSTQLIEAGIDVDFDVVFRDLAPLDAIFQSAGRCNRHGLRTGEVVVVHLCNESQRSFASFIYDSVKLDVTKKLLKYKHVVNEASFFKLLDRYFGELASRMSNRESKLYLQGVSSLSMDGEPNQERMPVSHFRLIEEDYEKMDVFIEQNEEAVKVFNRFERIVQIKDRWERRRAYDQIKTSFYRYVISIPVKIDNKPPIRNGIGYVGKSELRHYYDPFLGYIGESAVMIW